MTSAALEPEIASSLVENETFIRVHATPSQCTITPLSPTTNTSVGLEPQMLRAVIAGVAATTVKLPAVPWRIEVPAANTSVPLPQIALSCPAFGMATGDQLVPS